MLNGGNSFNGRNDSQALYYFFFHGCAKGDCVPLASQRFRIDGTGRYEC